MALSDGSLPRRAWMGGLLTALLAGLLAALLSLSLPALCLPEAMARAQRAAGPETAAIGAGYGAERQMESISMEIQNLIASSSFSDAVWSVIVRPSDRDTTLVSIRPGIIQPASNQKLLTSGALLDAYGPSHRLRTQVWIDGTIADGTLQGDLIVRGMGDPSLGASFQGESPFAFFNAVADALKRAGVRRIGGDLIANVSWFDGMAYPPGWSWDDLPFYYAVPVGPLSFRGNTVELEVHATGAPGEKPEILWFPLDTDYVRFINEQTIVPRGMPYVEGYDRLQGTNVIRLTSSLPQGMVEKESLSIHDPGAYFADTFGKVLRLAGIPVGGSARVETPPRDWDGGSLTLLLEYESPDLSVLLAEMNQESSNFVSEMLVKTLAADRSGAPGSTGEGLRRIRGQLADMGLDTTDIKLSDGSGLASGNLVSADELNRFLVIMRNHPHSEAYMASLAVNGRFGTLKNRLRGNGMEGVFRGKTGYVSGVRTLSGYLTTRGGGELAVTVATNHFIGSVSDIDRIHHSILSLLHERFP